MSVDGKDVLASFYVLCANIVLGKAKKEDVERITKEMIIIGQQKVMTKEFAEIAKILCN